MAPTIATNNVKPAATKSKGYTVYKVYPTTSILFQEVKLSVYMFDWVRGRDDRFCDKYPPRKIPTVMKLRVGHD